MYYGTMRVDWDGELVPVVPEAIDRCVGDCKGEALQGDSSLIRT
jgi:hypothetical protein